jgi:hypothetical protein
MARKGQFKKGGGRVGHATHTKRRKSTAMTHAPRTHTVYRTKYKTRHAVTKHRRRHAASGAGIKLGHLALATAGLAYVMSEKGPVPTVRTYAAKIPGAATFGTPAAVGIAALAIDRFVKRNKWLKLLGIAGVVLAATKLGDQGADFKFIGDEDFTGDVDDIGDE